VSADPLWSLSQISDAAATWRRLIAALPWRPRHRVKVWAAKSVGRETHHQHLPRPMEIFETSRPLGAMLIDCLQSETLTFIAAVKLAPSIDKTKVLPV
jgi:hypothetical protein